ncbi:TPA: hypothetical protein SMI12_001007 [Serratia liquefaciens]|nr:hypothetical protein [Serratia liquefaciens]
MNLGFGNNVKSALAADITATQTVISVMPGTGNLFAALLQPDPALENHSHPSKLYAKVTLTDAQETVFEICHLTAVSADKLTVIRGQEGTTAKGWSLNNTIANFATRGSEDNFVQIEDLQNGRYLAATAGGTANALTVDLPSTFYLNGGNTFALHAPLLITPTLTNTGASTLMLTLSGHVVGTYPLLKGNNTALQAGDVVAKSPFMAIFNTEQNRFLVMNPTTEIGVVRSVNTHKPDASGDVKLGTAADADIGTAPGNVMPVGAFGVGPAGAGRATLADLLSPDKGFTGFTWSVTGGDPDAPSFFPQGDTFGIQSQLWHNTVQYFSLQTAWRRNRIGFRMMEANVPGEWFEYFHTGRPPTATQTGALPLTGGTLTGQVIAPNFATTPNATPVGSGTYAQQLGSQAPFFQPNWQWPVTSGGVFVPIAKGTSTRKDKGWPTAISYGYLMPGEDMHAHPVIHALGDSGMENIWDFDTQTGGLRSGKAGEFATQNWVNSRCPFPVGYFMLMGNASDPNGLYPGTTWQDMTASYDGRVISLGYDPLGTGGSNSVSLGVEHMPAHSHGLKAYHSNTSLDGGSSNRYSVDPTNGAVADDVVVSSGGGQSFNVTNAYVHVRGWMRIA